ncbi:hypothetical protein UO65_0612 [Actinokineospora spheciospongiae]|uniref:YwqJ-like deaminase n=2 Tax=Actinokineospora spheciospongiae TaxID=909613 RepID=W7IT75_9PSEU|nr:hypothetical protein UO65_0612 [Actinokineospora spheciospongiae]
MMTNPLIAERQDSTTAYSGIGLAESAMDIYHGVEGGSWVEGGLGVVGTGLEMLSLALDPVGTLLQYAVSWLMEHVKPLSDALDWLAGDGDQIAAYAATWKNVGTETAAIAADFATEVVNGTAGWEGPAADAYRAFAKDKQDKIAAAGTGAGTIGTVVEVVGMLVGAVREIVRDLVAECVATLIARIPQWMAEIGGTLGVATPHVVASAVALISKWVNRIKDFITKLTRSLDKLRPLMGRLGELWDSLRDALRKTPGTPDTTPNTPDAVRTPTSVSDVLDGAPDATRSTPATPDAPSTTTDAPGSSAPTTTTPSGASTPSSTTDPTGGTPRTPSPTPSGTTTPSHVDTPTGSAPPTSHTPSGSTVPSGVTTPSAATPTAPPSAPGTHAPGGTTPSSAPTTQTGGGSGGNSGGGQPPPGAPTDPPPPPRPIPPNRTGSQSLGHLQGDLTRNSDGLITHVNGKPLDEHLRDLATQRTDEIRRMRDNGEISAKEAGPVNSVAVDTRTGEVFEGVNGRPRDVIPEADLHPVLRERLEEMRQNGPYQQYDRDTGQPLMRDGQPVMTEFPHGDNPLRHAEVKAVNDMLWKRGEDVDASVMSEFRVDNRFPFGKEGPGTAPCCANCNRMLAGTPSNAGRLTFDRGHPNSEFLPE